MIVTPSDLFNRFLERVEVANYLQSTTAMEGEGLPTVLQLALLVSRIPVFKSGGIDIFRSLRSTWISLTLTHGDSRGTSAGL